jgi:hypothetical protein
MNMSNTGMPNWLWPPPKKGGAQTEKKESPEARSRRAEEALDLAEAEPRIRVMKKLAKCKTRAAGARVLCAELRDMQDALDAFESVVESVRLGDQPETLRSEMLGALAWIIYFADQRAGEIIESTARRDGGADRCSVHLESISWTLDIFKDLLEGVQVVASKCHDVDLLKTATSIPFDALTKIEDIVRDIRDQLTLPTSGPSAPVGDKPGEGRT